MNKKLKKVMLLSMFLNIFSLLSTASFAETAFTHTQSVTQEVEFTLIVDGNIKVTADPLDFGDIVRGSTGDKKASTKVKVEIGDGQAHKIKAEFLQAGDNTPFDEKNNELIITRVENPDGSTNKTKQKEAPSADADQGTKNTLTVKLDNFEDEYIYEEKADSIKIDLSGTISEVPEDQMLGQYSGTVRVEIEVDGKEESGGGITTK